MLSFQDAPYRTTVMEPLGKMNAYFPVVNEHIAKRNKKVCLLFCHDGIALLNYRGHLDARL